MKIKLLDKKIIIERYNTGESAYELAKKYSVTPPCIYSVLKNNKIKIRTPHEAKAKKYQLNELFFENIDTEEKAYFLGLLFADGYNNEKGRVILTLQERDVDIIKKFNIVINSNRPLKLIKKKKDHHQNMYQLCIINKNFSLNLSKVGCTNNKSLTLKFPKIEQISLLRHFIRGYFDGDGCFYQNKKTYSCRASMCVSLCFGESFIEIIKNILNIKFRLYHRKNNKIKEVYINGKKQVKIFLDWIYSNSNVYLNRKYEKWKNFKNEYDQKNNLKKSRHTGVTHNNLSGKFEAYINHKNERIYLGQFKSEDEAANAYNQKIKDLNLNRKPNII